MLIPPVPTPAPVAAGRLPGQLLLPHRAPPASGSTPGPGAPPRPRPTAWPTTCASRPTARPAIAATPPTASPARGPAAAKDGLGQFVYPCSRGTAVANLTGVLPGQPFAKATGTGGGDFTLNPPYLFRQLGRPGAGLGPTLPRLPAAAAGRHAAGGARPAHRRRSVHPARPRAPPPQPPPRRRAGRGPLGGRGLDPGAGAAAGDRRSRRRPAPAPEGRHHRRRRWERRLLDHQRQHLRAALRDHRLPLGRATPAQRRAGLARSRGRLVAAGVGPLGPGAARPGRAGSVRRRATWCNKLRGTHSSVGGLGDRMPPPTAGEPLTEEEILSIEAWIRSGAPND